MSMVYNRYHVLSVICMLGLVPVASLKCFCQKQIRPEYTLKQIRLVCSKIYKGAYTLNKKYTLLQAGVDTASHLSQYKYYFVRNRLDTLVGYKVASFNADTSNTSVIFDGKCLLLNMPWRKTLEVSTINQYPEYIRSIIDPPLFEELNRNLLRERQRHNNRELLITKSSYRNKNAIKISFGNNHVYFIDALSYLPMGEIVKVNSSLNSFAQFQIFEEWIDKVSINKKVDGTVFLKNSLKNYTKEVMHSQENKTARSLILDDSASAPVWKLPLLTGDSLSLQDLAGKTVILDFWFKSCVPCQKQMFDLQKIQKLVDTARVIFVGINIYDDPKKEKLAAMLNKAGVSMKTAYHGEQIQQAYGVSGAPCLVIINKKGKIIYIKDGYSKDLTDDVLEILKQESSNE